MSLSQALIAAEQHAKFLLSHNDSNADCTVEILGGYRGPDRHFLVYHKPMGTRFPSINRANNMIVLTDLLQQLGVDTLSGWSI